MLSPHKVGVQESITSITFLAITKERILVFHIALASFARLSFRLKLNDSASKVTSSSLIKLDPNDLA